MHTPRTPEAQRTIDEATRLFPQAMEFIPDLDPKYAKSDDPYHALAMNLLAGEESPDYFPPVLTAQGPVRMSREEFVRRYGS